MTIYMKLAWRNLMRNKRRSFISGTAIGIGLASLIFVDALTAGMERNMVASATSTFLGDGEIHRAGFRATRQVDMTIEGLDGVVSGLRGEPIVKTFAVRAMSFAMISSPANVNSIELVGVDPGSERNVSEIDDAVFEGTYFAGENELDIVIGDKLAEALQVTLGDRIVVTVAQAGTGALSQELFRVSGVFRLDIPEMDRSMAFVRLHKAQEMLGIDGRAHEIALAFTDEKYGSDERIPFWSKYSQSGNEAVGWPVILPQLNAAFELSDFSTYVMGLILFGIVALGIINTLFMSLHERMFEFGVLRAVGTRPAAIAQMIVYEAAALALISIVLGSALGLAVTAITGKAGINYTGIEFAGATFRKLLYPVLRTSQFVEYPLWLLLFTALVSLYPATYAARMSAAEAMRKSM